MEGSEEIVPGLHKEKSVLHCKTTENLLLLLLNGGFEINISKPPFLHSLKVPFFP